MGYFVQFVYHWVLWYVQGWVMVDYLQYVYLELWYLQRLQGVVGVVQYEQAGVSWLFTELAE